MERARLSRVCNVVGSSFQMSGSSGNLKLLWGRLSAGDQPDKVVDVLQERDM